MIAKTGEPPAPGTGEVATTVVALAVTAAVYLKTLGAPSLWLDEAWEANYYAGYSMAPWYNRPILFMAGVRGLVRLFGPHEFVLRLLPCLAALGAVAATWRLARKALGRNEAWLAAGLLAVAPPILSYGHQLKHYTFDALSAVLLLAAYLSYARARSGRTLAVWAALAVVSFGVSFSSVFVVAAIAAVEFFAVWRERAPVAGFAIALVALGVAFAGLFFAFHASGTRDPLLTAYFAEAYAPVRNFRALPGWLLRAAASVVREQTGAGSQAAAVLLVAAGVVVARRTPGGRVVVSVLAVMTAAGVVASALVLYPFGVERLSLHFAPFVSILVAAAIGVLVREGPRRGSRTLAAAALALGLFAPALAGVQKYLSTGWRKEHVRDLVELLAREHRPGEGILVNDDARPAFRFYWNRSGRSERSEGIVTAARHRSHPERHAEGVAAMIARYPSFWGLFTHLSPEELETLRRLILERCRAVKSVVEGDARLDLYRCGDGP